MREAGVMEFELLRQIPDLSVTEYVICFIKLSKYVPHLHLSKKDLIR